MSIVICWPGVQGKDNIVVCARSNVVGSTLTLVITGGAGTPLPSAAQVSDPVNGDDGVIRWDITGLPDSDTLYEWTVSSTGAEDDFVGKTRTFPEYGPAKIATVSCMDNSDMGIARAIARSGAHILIMTGDESYLENRYFEYLNSTDETNAGATDTPRNALTQESHYRFKREIRDQVTKNWLWTQGVGFAVVVDDHDAFINDCADSFEHVIDYSVAQGNRDSGYSALNAPMWDTIKGYAANAISAYGKGNPVNTDPEAETDAYYFRFAIGDQEIFVLSQVFNSPTSMRPPFDTVAGEGLDNAMMSAEQTAWLRARVASSKYPYKGILAPKAVLSNQGANPDTWKSYNDMYPTLVNLSENTTGLMHIGGDYHSAGFFATRKGVPAGQPQSSQGLVDINGISGYDFDCVSTVASSAGRQTQFKSNDTWLNCDVRDSDKDLKGTTDPSIFVCTAANGRAGDRTLICFGTLETQGDGLVTSKLINSFSDVIFSGSVKSGTNYLYEGQKVADSVAGLHPSIANRLGHTADVAGMIALGQATGSSTVTASQQVSAYELYWHEIQPGDFISAVAGAGWDSTDLDRNHKVAAFGGVLDGSDFFIPDDMVIGSDQVIDYNGSSSDTILDAEFIEVSGLNIPIDGLGLTHINPMMITAGSYTVRALDNYALDSLTAQSPRQSSIAVDGEFDNPVTINGNANQSPVMYVVISNAGSPSALSTFINIGIGIGS